MSRVIDFSKIEVGKQYLYEEGYYMATIVTVIEDTSNNEYYSFVLRIDEWIDGMCKPLEQGYKFNISKRKDNMGCYLLKMSFKKVGSVTEYALKFY
jgi:hypothetical protein